MTSPRSLSAYRRGRHFVLIAKTNSDGIYFSKPPVKVVPRAASDEQLAGAIRAVAEAFTESVMPPKPEDRDEWTRATFESVGVKDWTTLERGARLAEVELSDQGWAIIPMRRRRRGGWNRAAGDDEPPGMRPKVIGADCTDSELSRALRDVLSGPTPTN